jgi:OFA family oxalate/formate antiporter-like MFS transporter
MIPASATKNRWLIAASAVGIHISIGSVYAYSVMINPLEKLVGWTKPEVTFAFSIAILFLGLSSAFLGFLVDKKGPRFSGRISACCYGLGILGTGLAIKLESYPLFVASYGVVGGIGLGLGYITPVTTLMKWFPDRRGMATGMAIMGFGFAALIFGPLMAYMFSVVNIPGTFFILGSLYFLLIFSSASYLAPPPKDWVPAGMKSTGKPNKRKEDLSDLRAVDALKTPRFYFLWVMLFVNVSCGIGIIAVASPLAQDVTGMSELQAAGVVGLMGLFNGLGRILWASSSDYLGRPLTYAAFFVIQILAFYFIVRMTDQWMFQILLYLILTCYGGGFATVPAFLGDLFGTRQVGTIHGYLLTAWSAAGMVGPSIITGLHKSTGDYVSTMNVYVLMFVGALVSTSLLWWNIRRIRAQMAKS